MSAPVSANGMADIATVELGGRGMLAMLLGIPIAHVRATALERPQPRGHRRRLSSMVQFEVHVATVPETLVTTEALQNASAILGLELDTTLSIGGSRCIAAAPPPPR